MKSDEEECLTTNLMAVSKETESLVKEAYTKWFLNSARLQNRNLFTLPHVAATRTPQHNSFIKPEVPPPVKTIDKELEKLQTFVLDALTPAHFPLESNAKGEIITHNQALDASKVAIEMSVHRLAMCEGPR